MYQQDDFDFGADLTDVEENNSPFDPIPADKYPLQATKIELADTKAGGKMVKVSFEVLSGQYANRKVFENFNIQHHNSQTVNIALGQIKQWLHACGLNHNQRLTLNLLRQLEGREFLGHVRVAKDKSGQYGDQNRMGKYEALAGASNPSPAPYQAAIPQASASTQAPPAAASNQSLPWAR